MATRRLKPEDILDFLQEVTGKLAFIDDRSLGGNEITTSIGASFEFKIIADTPMECALAYFWHVRHVYAHRDTGMRWLRKRMSLGRDRLLELEDEQRRKLAKLDEYARLRGLPPPAPKKGPATR